MRAQIEEAARIVAGHRALHDTTAYARQDLTLRGAELFGVVQAQRLRIDAQLESDLVLGQRFIGGQDDDGLAGFVRRDMRRASALSFHGNLMD